MRERRGAPHGQVAGAVVGDRAARLDRRARRAVVDDAPLDDDLGLGDRLLRVDAQKAIAEAEVVVERRIVNHRTSGAPIEPRGTVADYRAGHLTVWSSTPLPHLLPPILPGEPQTPDYNL